MPSSNKGEGFLFLGRSAPLGLIFLADGRYFLRLFVCLRQLSILKL